MTGIPKTLCTDLKKQTDKIMKEELLIFPGEKIVAEARRHWRNLAIPGLAIMLCLAALVCAMTDPTAVLRAFSHGRELQGTTVLIAGILEACFLIYLLGICIRDFIHVRGYRYYITTKRIMCIIPGDLMDSQIDAMMLERCESVRVTRKQGERRKDAGDILCIGAGKAILMEDVSGADEFAQRIREMVLVKREEEQGL